MVTHVCVQAVRVLPEFRLRELALTLVYLGQLKCRPQPAWVRAVLRHTAPLLSSANAVDLAHVAYGLAKLHGRPSKAVVQELHASALHRIRTFSPQQLAVMGWVLAMLRVRPSQAFVESALRCMHKMRAVLQPRERYLLMWAFEKWQLVQGPPVIQVHRSAGSER